MSATGLHRLRQLSFEFHELSLSFLTIKSYELARFAIQSVFSGKATFNKKEFYEQISYPLLSGPTILCKKFSLREGRLRAAHVV